MSETIFPNEFLESYKMQLGAVLLGAGLVLMLAGPKLSELTMKKAKGNIKRGIGRHAEKGAAISTMGFIMFSAGLGLMKP